MANSTLDVELRKQLLALLQGGQAHATFEAAVQDLPFELQGVVPERLPYSAWQLLEHLRITLLDILDFSDNEDNHYKELKWPEAYWPVSAIPPDAASWAKSVEAYQAHLQRFKLLVQTGDLVTPFPWGTGQNLLREALLVADHAAYHIGELIVVRRSLGAWKSA